MYIKCAKLGLVFKDISYSETTLGLRCVYLFLFRDINCHKREELRQKTRKREKSLSISVLFNLHCSSFLQDFFVTYFFFHEKINKFHNFIEIRTWKYKISYNLKWSYFLWKYGHFIFQSQFLFLFTLLKFCQIATLCTAEFYICTMYSR